MSITQGEAYDLMNSEFMKTLMVKINSEREAIRTDLCSLEFTSADGMKNALKCQAVIEAIDKMKEMITDVIEEITEQVGSA